MRDPNLDYCSICGVEIGGGVYCIKCGKMHIKVTEVKTLISAELWSAMRNHGSMKSSHEGYAVILEEMDELWDLVKVNPKRLANDAMRKNLNLDIRKEAIQVAAMAMRFVIDVCGEGE